MFAELQGLTSAATALINGKNVFRFKKHIGSISSYSANNIFYFPMMVSEDCSMDETDMGQKVVERQAAAFIMACVSLIPFHTVSERDRGSIEEYLQIFHQNIGIDTPFNMNNAMGKIFNESSTLNEEQQAKLFFAEVWNKTRNFDDYMSEIERDVVSINECFTDDRLTSKGKYLQMKVLENYRALESPVSNEATHEIDINVPGIDLDINLNDDQGIKAISAAQRENYRTFNNKEKMFADMDVKKANDVMPLFFKVQVGFIIQETSETIMHEVLIGVKAFVHKIPSAKMVGNLATSIKRNQKFLEFVKWSTGETKSLMDVIFGFQQIKFDTHSIKGMDQDMEYLIKKRVNWKKQGVKYVTRNWNPNVTAMMTMNEANFMKDHLGIDIMRGRHIKTVMDDNYLLMFIILDQINRLAHIMYDGHRYQFQEYSYNALERETTERDRATKELFRTFSRGGH